MRITDLVSEIIATMPVGDGAEAVVILTRIRRVLVIVDFDLSAADFVTFCDVAHDCPFLILIFTFPTRLLVQHMGYEISP